MLYGATIILLRTVARSVVFRESSAESMSFPNESFDVVISNGVINLILIKPRL